jgi:putative membrane protein
MSESSRINKDLILRENLALQRTELANQTTLLAFIRTFMYFLMAGLTLRNIFKSFQQIEIIFYIISAILFLGGIINYFYQRRLIKRSEIHVGDYKTEYMNG